MRRSPSSAPFAILAVAAILVVLSFATAVRGQGQSGGALPQALATTATPQFAGLGIGVAGVSGQILAGAGTSANPGLANAAGTSGIWWNSNWPTFVNAGSPVVAVGTSGFGLSMHRDRCVTWESGGGSWGGVDTALCRNAAGVVEINTGTMAAYRDLKLRKLTWTNDAEPTCNSTNRGVLVMVQGGGGVADTFRICSKDAADAYAYRALY